MSDENEKEDAKKEAWNWADLGGTMGSVEKIMASLQSIEGLMDGRKIKLAIDLAPGDVIRIGHRSVFLVGVELKERDNPSTLEHGLMVQAIGAEAWYQSNDWTWASNDVMHDSPFLRFRPSEEVVLERESPSGTNTLDQFIVMREQLHKEREKKEKEKKGSREKWEQWASASEWGQEAYASKVESEEKKEGPHEKNPDGESDGEPDLS